MKKKKKKKREQRKKNGYLLIGWIYTEHIFGERNISESSILAVFTSSPFDHLFSQGSY